MLRLKPSELALMPDDVDETLRRMARRQQSRALAARGQRQTRPNGRPPPPRLMLGPQRSARDAITHLGNIPALQPQQAVIAHVDDESDESDEALTDPAQRADSSPDPLALPTHSVHLMSTSSAAAAAAAAAPSARHLDIPAGGRTTIKNQPPLRKSTQMILRERLLSHPVFPSRR
jgi:hypothetical protein